MSSLDQPSGQTIGSELEKYYESEINYGRLYPSLDTLVDEGLVEKGELNGRTNFYALAEAGDQTLRDRRKWEN